MTDKNRDISKIRVGTVVAFRNHSTTTNPESRYEVTFTRPHEIRFINGSALHKVYRHHWHSMGGYIVSQPEAPDKKCEDCPPLGYPTAATRCAPCPHRSTEARESAEQVIVQTREEQIESIAHIGKDAPCLRDNPHGWARRQVLEAEARGASEQRGTDAVHDKPIAYVNLDRLKWKLETGSSVCLTFSSEPVTEGHLHHQMRDPIYSAPQPDIQAAKIAELESIMDETGNSILRVTKLNDLQNQSISLMESKIAEQAATIARLREALKKVQSAIGHRINDLSIIDTVWMEGGIETMRDFIVSILAATEKK